jgi:hypothetical protein
MTCTDDLLIDGESGLWREWGHLGCEEFTEDNQLSWS